MFPEPLRIVIATLLAAACASCLAESRATMPARRAHAGPPTPAERTDYRRPSSSAEVHGFLVDVAQRSDAARLEPIGVSARGTTMEALLLSRDPEALAAGTTAERVRLVVLFVGSQHGTEPSGTEALLGLARDVALGPRADLLDDLDLVIVANGNPDGRDAGRRVNGNGVNLSTNFVSLSEPEARAIDGALRRWQPDVTLDVHESAVHKPKSLARDGFLTDVEAQVEFANNPNVDTRLSTFARVDLLPAVLRGIGAHGLRAEHYLGEITTLSQPVTHGGVTARNLRNHAGLLGGLSFLLENRLDPKEGRYDTPRNLRARVAKQRLAIDVFLDEVQRRREDIRRRTERARDPRATPAATASLVASYAPDTHHSFVRVRLRPVGGGPVVEREFPYHGRILGDVYVRPPQAYAVTDHQRRVGELLDRHAVSYVVLDQPTRVTAEILRVESARPVVHPHGWGYTAYRGRPRRTVITLPRGSLWVPLDQLARRLLPLWLDPRSNSSLFQEPADAPLVRVGSDFFVVGVVGAANEGRPAVPPTGRVRRNRVP